jgi:small subunit ribosomal protein S16
MPIKIRLRRMGRKKQPHYRVVVADSDSPRDGRFVESLGYYRPLSHPARLVLDMERVEYWEGKGALPTTTVASLLKKVRRGGDASVAIGEVDKAAEKLAYQEALAARRRSESEVQAQATAKAEAEAKAAAEAKEAKAKKKEKPKAEAPEVEEAAEEPVAEAAAPEEPAAPEVEAAAEPEAAVAEEPAAPEPKAAPEAEASTPEEPAAEEAEPAPVEGESVAEAADEKKPE